MQKIEHTTLWRHTLAEQLGVRSKRSALEQAHVNRLRQSFIQFRDRTIQLVDQIDSSFKHLTVHNMEHIDALWECASLLLGDQKSINPAEAYVLGGAFLLHDAGLALSSYPDHMDDIKTKPLWRDSVAQMFLQKNGRGIRPNEFETLSEDVKEPALELFLRLNHAANAELLGTAQFNLPSENTSLYLIDDSELRLAFGDLIGRIAYSHWWPVEKVTSEFATRFGALPTSPTEWSIDSLNIALLLRVSDAMQIDSRRAPAFRRALRKPEGIAEHHWLFQQRMLAPVVQDGGVRYTSSKPFALADSEAWWVGQELLKVADAELRSADTILQQTGRERFKANHVVGAYDPKVLARVVRVSGWEPVATRLHVSNVAQVVERLGGKQLYGDDPHVALRELLQNARDAVVARRLKYALPADSGQITVNLVEVDGKQRLSVTDTGIGMSESTLSSALLDFGKSYWQTQEMLHDHPGLAASGFEPSGQFGIGFFSVFLLGDKVKVITRRPEDGQNDTRVLEFQGGVGGRVFIRPAATAEQLHDAGTKVVVDLRIDAKKQRGILGPAVVPTMSRSGSNFQYNKQEPWTLKDLYFTRRGMMPG
ncbi:MAG TPA: ATP-binding protein [Planctomycetaceae bacterium]|nr:ATP-binding protein [Planctomycetaceae bacterium]HQZ66878.1 ATP-binding protein [Planctomycetaceae bacterium]